MRFIVVLVTLSTLHVYLSLCFQISYSELPHSLQSSTQELFLSVCLSSSCIRTTTVPLTLANQDSDTAYNMSRPLLLPSILMALLSLLSPALCAAVPGVNTLEPDLAIKTTTVTPPPSPHPTTVYVAVPSTETVSNVITQASTTTLVQSKCPWWRPCPVSSEYHNYPPCFMKPKNYPDPCTNWLGKTRLFPGDKPRWNATPLLAARTTMPESVSISEAHNIPAPAIAVATTTTTISKVSTSISTSTSTALPYCRKHFPGMHPRPRRPCIYVVGTITHTREYRMPTTSPLSTKPSKTHRSGSSTTVTAIASRDQGLLPKCAARYGVPLCNAWSKFSTWAHLGTPTVTVNAAGSAST